MSETYRTLPNAQKVGADGLPLCNDASPFRVRHLRRVITSAEILTLNSVQVVLVPAVAGIAYGVRSFHCSYNHGGTDYASANLDMVLQVNAVTISLITNAVSGTADKASQGDIKNAILEPGAELILAEGGGDATTGNGTVTIYVEYIEIPVP